MAKRKRKHPCFGKQTFSDLDAVKDKIALNYLKDRDALNYYECPICLDFHLTSKRPQVPKIEPERLHRILNLRPTKRIIEGRMNVVKITKKQRERASTLPIQKQREALRRLNRNWLQRLIAKWVGRV